MRYARESALTCALLFSACLATVPSPALAQFQPQTYADAVSVQQPMPAAQTLYRRLGGYDGIAALTDDFIVRLVQDPKLQKFFGGLSDDSKGRIRQLVVDQLCAATGGPCIYTGRDLKTAHKGLGISEDDWQQSLVDLNASFDKLHVGPAERRDLAAALGPLKADIVQPAR